MTLKDRTALVTGASRGIGAAISDALADAGASVMLCARSDGDISRNAQAIRERGGAAAATACDVVDFKQINTAVEAAEAAFGPVDILVNNAGIIEPVAHLATSEPADWGRLIDVNIKGVYHGMRAVMPGMLARGAGTIINIGSGAAHNALEGWSAYCASKAAVLQLTRSAHKEGGAAGIVSINLSPGTVATDMQRVIRASAMNPVSQLDWDAHKPPEWVGAAVVWLCGPDGAAFAGEEIRLSEDVLTRMGIG